MADKREILISLLGEETVARMADRAGDGLERFGDKLDATEKDAADLDRQIGEVEGSLKTLATAFARTSDAADRVDLTKAMRRQQIELNRLTKSRKLLPDFAKEGEDAAGGFAAAFVARVGPLIARAPLGPVGAVVGGAMAAFLVPTLAAAVQGAVVGGVGVGGVIGGVALAARDTRVKAAGRQLGEAVMGDLDESAARFVQPTIRGIQIIRGAWEDIADDVDGVFAASARYVEPLARGLGGLFRELAPGLRKAAEAAGPIIREISEGLPRIGRALGDVFSDFADNADAGASAVRYLFMFVEEGIQFVGGAINAFAALYRTVLDVADAAVTAADALYGWNPLFSDRIDEGRKKVDELKGALEKGGDAGSTAGAKVEGGLIRAGNAADTSAAKIQTWADVVDESTGRAFESEHANIRLEQAIDDAAQAAKDGAKKGIDPNTKAGRENRLALLGIAEAAKDGAKKIREQTGSQELASKATERGRAAFLRSAAAMGVSKKEAKELADKLFGIPKERNTKADFQGDNKGVTDWKRTLSGIPRTIFIKAEFDLINNKEVAMALRLGRLSKGGPVTGPGPKGVDSRPYLLAPGEHVLTAAEVDAAGGHSGVERLRAMLRGGGAPAVAAAGRPGMAGGGGGGSVTNYYSIAVNVPPAANLAEVGRATVEAIKAHERTSGKVWVRA